jgi:hypothetical protein
MQSEPFSANRLPLSAEAGHIMATVGTLDARFPSTKSLLRAYIACLTFDDLCAAIAHNLSAPGHIRSALKGRLLRILKEPLDQEVLNRLVEVTSSAAQLNRPLRPIVDALHSGIFDSLPLPTQHDLMERWLDRGTRGALRRWLKAAKVHPELFDETAMMGVWTRTADPLALRAICLQGSEVLLRSLLPDIVKSCEDGWLVGKAVLRAGASDDETWDEIKAKHPATYLYLCAKLQRKVDEKSAIDLVLATPEFGYPDVRSLAIWALGEMGMRSSLDELRRLLDAT